MDSGSARNGKGTPSARREDFRRYLATVYDTCAARMFGYAAMVLADPAAAEDAVQQVFVKLARRGRLEDVRSAAVYLRQAVRNECFSMLKRRQRHRQATGGRAWLEALPAPDPPQRCDELRGEMERALKALTPQQREVVHMKVFEKMTFQQIADATGVPANTAASRYRYALGHLRELLGPSARDEL